MVENSIIDFVLLDTLPRSKNNKTSLSALHSETVASPLN
jgi:hypothetical protein